MCDTRTAILFKTLGLLMSIGLLIPHPAKAQYTGFKPVADLIAFKKQFATESAKVSTITSNFTQIKTLTALTETITSTGKFWFQRSNRVRIDYQKPFHYLIVM